MTTIPKEILLSHLFPHVKDGGRFNVLIACKEWNSMGKELFVPSIDDFKRVITCDDHDTLFLFDKVCNIASHPKVDAVSLIKPYSECYSKLIYDARGKGEEVYDDTKVKAYGTSLSNMTRIIGIIMDNVKHYSVITPEELGLFNIVYGEKEKNNILFNRIHMYKNELRDVILRMYNPDQVIYTLYSNPKVFDLIPTLLDKRLSLEVGSMNLRYRNSLMDLLIDTGTDLNNLGLIKVALENRIQKDNERKLGDMIDLSINRYLRNPGNTIALDVMLLLSQHFPSVVIESVEDRYIAELKYNHTEQAKSLECISFMNSSGAITRYIIEKLKDTNTLRSFHTITSIVNNDHYRKKICTMDILNAIFWNGCNYTQAINDGLMLSLEEIPNFYEEMEWRHIYFLLEHHSKVQAQFILFLKNREQFKWKRPELHKMLETGGYSTLNTIEEVVDRECKRLKKK